MLQELHHVGLFGKVILVRSLEDISLAGGDADAIFNHEFSEAGSVDEDDLLADLMDKLAHTGSEPSNLGNEIFSSPWRLRV